MLKFAITGIYTVMSDIEAKERLEVVKSFIQCNMNSVIECSLEFSQLSTIFVEVFGGFLILTLNTRFSM